MRRMLRWRWLGAAALFVLLALGAATTLRVAPAEAGAPGNDKQSKAQLLDTLPATVTGTTVGSTGEPTDPQCGPGVQETVWYRFSRDAAGTVMIELRAGGALDAVVSAHQVVGGELKLLACQPTDAKGRARIVLESKPASGKAVDYLLSVGQRANSDPGSFTLKVSAPSRPGNDERAGAVALGTLPATVGGTTLGATSDPADPCTEGAGTVWYRMPPGKGGPVVARFRAGGDLEAVVCAVEKVRSQLRLLERARTNDQGDASLSFTARKGIVVYLVVGQSYTATPGQFTLMVVAPERPPTPPGEPLGVHGGRGSLDGLQDPADAWAVQLARGVTYRLRAEGTRSRCISAAVFQPRLDSYSAAAPVAVSACGETMLFTPGPDGGGVYSILLRLGEGATRYRLTVHEASADDIGPGVLLESGALVKGLVSKDDLLDLYRFDAPTVSDVRLIATATRDLSMRLTDDTGRTIATGQVGRKLVHTVEPGTYYVAIRSTGPTAVYRLRALVREVTETTLAVGYGSSTRVRPGQPVPLRTTTSPAPGGGKTRVEADFFDVATRTWVFRRVWDVPPGTSVSFAPGAVGAWRFRATFYGSDTASPSRSGYARMEVATLDP